MHELGHRYWRKLAERPRKLAWYRQHIRTESKEIDLPMPGVGDPLPVRVRGAPRGWRPVVKSRDKSKFYYDRPDGSMGEALVFNIWKLVRHNESAALRFPTAYSAQNEEEHFCEALKLHAAGVLPPEHDVPFKTIWG